MSAIQICVYQNYKLIFAVGRQGHSETAGTENGNLVNAQSLPDLTNCKHCCESKLYLEVRRLSHFEATSYFSVIKVLLILYFILKLWSLIE